MRLEELRPFVLSRRSRIEGWAKPAGFEIKFKTKAVGGGPTASHFFLLRQEKVTKKKATPLRRPFGVPCVARLIRRLRNSRYALRQSSPTTPDQSVLLGCAQGKEIQNLKTHPQTREAGLPASPKQKEKRAQSAHKTAFDFHSLERRRVAQDGRG